jgi:hypothetical protein
MFTFKKKSNSSPSFPSPTGALSGSSEPLGSFPISQKKFELGERIEKSNDVTTFEYVSVIPSDSRTKKNILTLLMSKQSALSSDPIPVNKLPVINLKERETLIPLSNALSENQWNKLDDWITVYELFVSFCPAQSFYHEHSRVFFRIRDSRFQHDTVVKETEAWNNAVVNTYMSLDYSIHKSDIGSLVFEISNPTSALKEDIIWGSLSLQISLKQSKTAVPSSIIPVTGVVSLHSSALSKPATNPNHLDLTFNPSNLKELSKMKKRGLIKDLSRPNQKVNINDFTGSEAGGSSIQEDSDEEEEALAGPSFGIIAARNAIDNKKRSKIASWSSAVSKDISEHKDRQEDLTFINNNFKNLKREEPVRSLIIETEDSLEGTSSHAENPFSDDAEVEAKKREIEEEVKILTERLKESRLALEKEVRNLKDNADKEEEVITFNSENPSSEVLHREVMSHSINEEMEDDISSPLEEGQSSSQGAKSGKVVRFKSQGSSKMSLLPHPAVRASWN